MSKLANLKSSVSLFENTLKKAREAREFLNLDISEDEANLVSEDINSIKEKVDSLDDETFDELIKEFGESYNLQEFDILLDMECHSDKEATKLLEMIDKFTYYTRKNLKSKIEKLTLLYKKF